MPIDPNIRVDTAHPKRGVPIVPSEISNGVVLPTDGEGSTYPSDSSTVYATVEPEEQTEE